MPKGDGARRVRSIGLFSLAAAAFCSTLLAKEHKPDIVASSHQAATTALPYPDTPQGLQNLVKHMIKLEKQGKKDKLAAYSKSLSLPDTENWFKSVFGRQGRGD